MTSTGGKKGGKGAASKAEPGNSRLAVLASLVLLSFTIFGYAQEAITATQWEGGKFKFPTFLILIQSFGSMAISALILAMRGTKDWSGGVGILEWAKPSGAQFAAHACSFMALSYIPFPVQVVCKSCKSVPVMLGEMVLTGKRHSWDKRIAVVLMTASVTVFTLAGGSKKGSSDMELTPAFIGGLGLVLTALVFDGIYGPYLKRIEDTNAQVTETHMQYQVNKIEFFMALALALVEGELFHAVDMIQRNPDLVPRLIFFAATMALGQVFIFKMQSEFSALIVTMTTTVRKLLSVLFSVLWFGHALGIAQWACVVLVFTSAPVSKVLAKVLGLTDAAPKKKAA